MHGTLYLVATPIGNLGDMSERAVETLRSVDIIACEDTRHSGKLMRHFGIETRLISYHDHNEAERAAELAEMLESGSSVAVISDAGTPAISDPSYRIVQSAHRIGARVVPIPGPAAFVNAVISSGLPTDSIFFGGFLPSRSGERRRRLEETAEIPATLVFYESPHRLLKSLADCLDVLGDREAAIARELTKLHEEIVPGTISFLIERYSSANIKGEIVLVIDRKRAPSRDAGSATLKERVSMLEAEGLDRKASLKRAAKEFGLSRSEAYRLLQSGRE